MDFTDSLLPSTIARTLPHLYNRTTLTHNLPTNNTKKDESPTTPTTPHHTTSTTRTSTPTPLPHITPQQRQSDARLEPATRPHPPLLRSSVGPCAIGEYPRQVLGRAALGRRVSAQTPKPTHLPGDGSASHCIATTHRLSRECGYTPHGSMFRTTLSASFLWLLASSLPHAWPMLPFYSFAPGGP